MGHKEIRWQNLAQSLTSTAEEVAVRKQYPSPPQSLSLLDSLATASVAATSEHAEAGQRLNTELSGLLSQLSAQESLGRCPIVGVAGILNAGKSSLLATYLTPENRRRVLRGVDNNAGTHRFVLWLPERWQQTPELFNTLVGFVTQLFGNMPEQLADDPQQAAQQYNGRLSDAYRTGSNTDPLGVPLLAFDSALDHLQLGLLDCPDIQTGLPLDQVPKPSQATDTEPPAIDPTLPADAASQRQHRLAAIGRLCSAFVIVTKLNSLHDQSLLDILGTLQRCMAGVPRILAINRVKARYQPETIAHESQEIADKYQISSVYMAYDFRSNLADQVVPPLPKNMRPELDGSPQPVFFKSVLPSQQFNAPIRYLLDLGQQLDIGSLAMESMRSLLVQLRGVAEATIAWHRQNPIMRQQQIQDAWKVLAEACYRFMADRDSSGTIVGLKLQTSPAVIAQMSGSLRRTAPVWMKPSLSVDQGVRKIQQAISQRTERIKILQNASQAVTDFVRKFRRSDGVQVVTAEVVAKSLRELDLHGCFSSYPADLLRIGCETALTRFSEEDRPDLDMPTLDQWSRSIWSNMPFTTKLRRGVQPLALAIGPLLAALLVPIDGGGSAVLVFASTKELLAAAGVATILTPLAGGGETLSIVNEETPWRQLSDLFAILCDGLGIPRPTLDQLPTCGATAKRLLPSQIQVQPSTIHSPLEVWLPAAGALERVEHLLM